MRRQLLAKRQVALFSEKRRRREKAAGSGVSPAAGGWREDIMRHIAMAAPSSLSHVALANQHNI